MTRIRWFGLAFLLPLAWIVGCGSAASTSGGSGGASAVAKKLPKLDAYFGPVDDGRISQIAPPKGWVTAGRSSKYVCRFLAPEGESYPTIIVTAEDFDRIHNVTPKNVEKFAKLIAAEFKDSESAQRMVITPERVGKFNGVSYVRRGRAKVGSKTIVVDRYVLSTVVDGRMYNVELRTRDDDQKYRGHAMAVAAGIKYRGDSSGAGASETATAMPEAGEEAPAAEETEAKPESEPEAEAPQESEPAPAKPAPAKAAAGGGGFEEEF